MQVLSVARITSKAHEFYKKDEMDKRPPLCVLYDSAAPSTAPLLRTAADEKLYIPLDNDFRDAYPPTLGHRVGCQGGAPFGLKLLFSSTLMLISQSAWHNATSDRVQMRGFYLIW